MSDCKYFVIPFDSVPNNPGYTVWYASWSTQRPSLEPGMQPPVVVGVTSGDLPAAATPLAAGGKDPPPPPPPLTANMSSYQSSISAWIQLGRDA
jgi:hypothetical protein